MTAQPLLSAIEATLRELGSLNQLLGNFYYDEKGSANAELHMHLESLMTHYKLIDGLKETVRDAVVPLDMLDHLDRTEHSNPDLYTLNKVELFLEEKERHERMAKDIETVQKLL